jgi:hypothetical protein
MSVSGERVAHPVLLARKSLGVEEHASIKDDESQVHGGLELKWVVVVQEV